MSSHSGDDDLGQGQQNGLASEPAPEKPARARKAKPEPTLLQQLGAKFSPSEVKQREASNGKLLDYIAIDTTIHRLHKVLGLDWEFVGEESRVDGPFSKRVKRKVWSDEERKKVWREVDGEFWLAKVSGHLIVAGNRHYGVGSDYADDPDKALKTALAEAIKKAGHQLDIGLYLWSEVERDLLGVQRSMVNDAPKLRSHLAKRAAEEGVRLGKDAAENRRLLAAHYGVEEAAFDHLPDLQKLAGVAS